MKPQFVTLKFIVVAAITFACLGTFQTFAAEATGDPVTIEKDRILIPGTNISESDQRAMNAILAQCDKSLYKLKGYVNGKAGKQQGTLNDAAIDKATAARAAVHAKDPRFTGSTLQIGFTANQDISRRPGNTSNQDVSKKPGSTANQNKPGTTTNQDWTTKAGITSNQEVVNGPSPTPHDASKARELVKRLTPILRKYSKSQSAR